jgi:hypothetical protein
LPEQSLEQPAHDKPEVIVKQPPLTHSDPLLHDGPPGPQVHAPFAQVAPAAQQVSPQRSPHIPPQQPCPAPQACPQAPQCCASVCRSAHASPQQVCPVPQAPHSRLPPQPSGTLPHWPGWQIVCGVQQLPAVQTWSRAQVLSQIPQFSGSVCRSVQISPQQLRLGPQHVPADSQQDSSAQQVAPQHISPPRQQTAKQQVRSLGQHSVSQQ